MHSRKTGVCVVHGDARNTGMVTVRPTRPPISHAMLGLLRGDAGTADVTDEVALRTALAAGSMLAADVDQRIRGVTVRPSTKPAVFGLMPPPNAAHTRRVIRPHLP